MIQFIGRCALVFLTGLALAQPAMAQNLAASELGAQAGGSVVPGKIRSLTGLVSIQNAQGKSKFAAAGTRLAVGDTVITQEKSTALLEFADSTQVALRPGSRFLVEQYNYDLEQPAADRADFKLLKGGLRTLTGLIGKRGTADAFSMKSETATIGIRGTDFSARICQPGECNKLGVNEADRPSATNPSSADVAGRVSQVTGNLEARMGDAKVRKLAASAAFFAGDVLTVAPGGFAVLSMADGTRLTLPGGSSLEVAAYRYVPASPQTSVASFKLLKGAVRAVTGAIAKAEPNNVKFYTDTATVGIRGTALDMSCTTTVQGEITLTSCSGSAQFNVELRDGKIVVTQPNGQSATLSGLQALVLKPGATQFELLPAPPGLLDQLPNAGPKPEQTPANFEILSATPISTLDGGGGGQLFVAVNDGTIVIINGNQPPLEVNRGEGAFVSTQSDAPPQLLSSPPDILVQDNTLSAPPFTAPQCAP